MARPRADSHTAGRQLSVLVSFSGAGGVERMVANLLGELVRLEVPVELVLMRAESAHLQAIPAQVEVVRLGSRHTFTSILKLARYLRLRRPTALLAAKDRAGQAALIARRLSGVHVPVSIRLGTHLSASLAGQSPLARASRYLPMRLLYRGADRVIAVSEGVAADTARITGLPPERIVVVRNPVVTSEMLACARQEPAHPWLGPGQPAVVLGAGRLTRQKDFPTLLRAFAELWRRQPCRLVVLGEGRERPRLEQLARDLGVAADVSLPGFVGNPYAYMARSALFVLSSAWEGSPNVLTEALALGIPVVSTDCPSGPREILQSGRYGRLVAVGDAAGLAEAMAETLRNPPTADFLRQAAQPYSAESSALEYLHALGWAAGPAGVRLSRPGTQTWSREERGRFPGAEQ
jgi:glycosyltransferase involved in cell wall biosynthesis